MDGSSWLVLGWAVGTIYALYAWLLFLGCVGPHLFLLVGYVWPTTRRDFPTLCFLLELGYGLLNPVVYLLVFQPALFRSVSPGWLTTLSWALLALYWCTRLLIPLAALRTTAGRRGAQGLLVFCLALVVAVGARDLGLTLRFPYTDINQPYRSHIPLLMSPLYAWPIVIALLQLRRLRSGEQLASDDFSVLSSVARRAASAVTLTALVAVLVSSWRPSIAATRELLLRHRADIVTASERAKLDPRLMASIVFVIHREHTTPFRSALEAMTASAWSVDSKSHMLISKALNPSLGLAQVKPVTALTALALQHRSLGIRTWLPNKEYREVLDEGDVYKRIPTPALARLEPPLEPEEVGKREVVTALLDPASNLALATFVLDVTATQWEAADARWSIRARPDILATLYQIGFQRSQPKPDPRANDFGRQVLQAFDEPWMREHFAPRGAAADAP